MKTVKKSVRKGRANNGNQRDFLVRITEKKIKTQAIKIRKKIFLIKKIMKKVCRLAKLTKKIKTMWIKKIKMFSRDKCKLKEPCHMKHNKKIQQKQMEVSV